MITVEKLKIFKKYQGDGDAFIRIGKKNEKRIMDYSDWRNIDELIQDIGLIKKKLASAEYEKSVSNKLRNYCESQSVMEELWEMG